jgi:hypothetical protein
MGGIKMDGHGAHDLEDDMTVESCSSIRKSKLDSLLCGIKSKRGMDLFTLTMLDRMDPWGPFWDVDSHEEEGRVCKLGAPVLKGTTSVEKEVFIRDYAIYILDLLYSTQTHDSLFFFPVSLCIHPMVRDIMAKLAFGTRLDKVTNMDWLGYFRQLPNLDSSVIGAVILLEDLLVKTRRSEYWKDTEAMEVNDLKLVSDRELQQKNQDSSGLTTSLGCPRSSKSIILATEDHETEVTELLTVGEVEGMTKEKKMTRGRFQAKELTKRSGRTLKDEKGAVEVGQAVSGRRSPEGHSAMVKELQRRSRLDTNRQVPRELPVASGILQGHPQVSLQVSTGPSSCGTISEDFGANERVCIDCLKIDKTWCLGSGVEEEEMKICKASEAEELVGKMDCAAVQEMCWEKKNSPDSAESMDKIDTLYLDSVADGEKLIVSRVPEDQVSDFMREELVAVGVLKKQPDQEKKDQDSSAIGFVVKFYEDGIESQEAQALCISDGIEESGEYRIDLWSPVPDAVQRQNYGALCTADVSEGVADLAPVKMDQITYSVRGRRNLVQVLQDQKLPRTEGRVFTVGEEEQLHTLCDEEAVLPKKEIKKSVVIFEFQYFKKMKKCISVRSNERTTEPEDEEDFYTFVDEVTSQGTKSWKQAIVGAGHCSDCHVWYGDTMKLDGAKYKYKNWVGKSGPGSTIASSEEPTCGRVALSMMNKRLLENMRLFKSVWRMNIGLKLVSSDSLKSVWDCSSQYQDSVFVWDPGGFIWDPGGVYTSDLWKFFKYSKPIYEEVIGCGHHQDISIVMDKRILRNSPRLIRTVQVFN